MKIDWKTSSESNTVSGILFGAILGPFWIDFEPIFDPKSFIWRPESSKIASRRPLERSFDFHWFLGFLPGRPGGRGRRQLTWVGVLVASRRNHWFWGKPCWESSPSASCDNGPRKPQYRKLRFLWKYKLACIFCRPSAKRRGQHGSKRRWDRVERGAADPSTRCVNRRAAWCQSMCLIYPCSMLSTLATNLWKLSGCVCV